MAKRMACCASEEPKKKPKKKKAPKLEKLRLGFGSSPEAREYLTQRVKPIIPVGQWLWRNSGRKKRHSLGQKSIEEEEEDKCSNLIFSLVPKPVAS